MFSSSSSTVSGLILQALIYLEFTSVPGKRDPVSVFYMWISSFPTTTYKRDVVFPMCIFGVFVMNQIAVASWVYFWNFSSIPVVRLSVVWQYLTVMVLKYTFKSDVVSPTLLFANNNYTP
jgi:hypothetical protein